MSAELNAVFLEGVSTELTALAKALERQHTATCELLKVARDEVKTADTYWDGPRSVKIVTDSMNYLTAVAEYPRAVSAAESTVSRWATAAHKMAGDMALQEVQIVPRSPYGSNEEDRDASENAEAEIGRLQGAWGRICILFSNELNDVITAIQIANRETGIAIDRDDATRLRAQMDLAELDGPEGVRLWWNGLTDEEKLTLLATYPGLLGNLDGLPAKDRDIANRTQLIKDLDRLEALEATGDLGFGHAADRRELANIRHLLEQLKNGDAYKDPITGEPVGCQLYIYDPGAFRGDGRVAISTGDLDRASHLAVMVPGLKTNVAGMSNGDSQNLYDETRFASGESVAVLNWQGYNTPDWGGARDDPAGTLLDTAGVTVPVKADHGAEQLASDVDGLNGMREDDSHLTVIGHSYGSTTTSIAAHEYGLDADDVVLIGSPGVGGNQNADDFSTGSDHTWVGSASNDPVSWAPALGNDPAHEDFGGTRFTAENDESFSPDLPSHTSYYNDHSESLYNISSVTSGQYDHVIDAEDRDDVSHLQFGLDGPPGIQDFPSIDIDLDGVTDPEGDRDPTSGHTHQPLLPGGPTQPGQRVP